MKKFIPLSVVMAIALIACNSSKQKAPVETAAVQLEAFTATNSSEVIKLEMISRDEDLLQLGKCKVKMTNNKQEGKSLICAVNNRLVTTGDSSGIDFHQGLGQGPLLLFIHAIDKSGFVQKNDNYLLKEITLEENSESKYNLNKPHLMVLSPVKNNSYKQTNLILDMKLCNDPGDCEVRQIWDDTDTTLSEVSGTFKIKGLAAGAHKVRLELIDKMGEVVPGPFNVTERTFTLK